ncbi:phosphate butyryltransferase (plasmid) [Fulvitalea axinellae]|uniref:Phosphate butyryltransferase n=1 Tax=Fulvitalea axinellae TaxID=1182444 RepID=A0AAU9D056_9BACT|nr:phosphate butyryltransferase [Fulvitalea axinellae]
MSAIKKLDDLKKVVKGLTEKKKLVLAAAGDEHSLHAVHSAWQQGLIEPILVGDERRIRQVAEQEGADLHDVRIIHEIDPKKTVMRSVKMIHDQQADVLMKGHVGTADLLRGVLHKDWGLRTRKLLSHFAWFEIPAYDKLLALTDVAMNIAPNLRDKMEIINNAVEFLNKLGIDNPKVAAVAAVEMVNEQMQATTDAALLSIMCRRGQIKNCVIDGPLAFDNAISTESSEHKGIMSEVAGHADMLLAPDIEAGNVLYKAFVFFVKAKVASVILGASAPIVLTSRADSEETKLSSIMLAAASSMSREDLEKQLRS